MSGEGGPAPNPRQGQLCSWMSSGRGVTFPRSAEAGRYYFGIRIGLGKVGRDLVNSSKPFETDKKDRPARVDRLLVPSVMHVTARTLQDADR